MHIKDYCFLVFASGIFVGVLSYWAAYNRYIWWKDVAQIAGVMLVVSMTLGILTPPKPRILVAEARDAAAASEAAEEKLRSRMTIEAMGACDNAIQANLQYPGSYSKTIFSTSNRQVETARGWEIYAAFEAKNGYGGSLPHVGHCSITRSGSVSVEISRS